MSQKLIALQATFWWGTKFWEDVEQLGVSGVTVTETGVNLNQKVYMKRESFNIYGLLLCSGNNVDCRSGFLLFRNKNDYKIHREASLPITA